MRVKSIGQDIIEKETSLENRCGHESASPASNQTPANYTNNQINTAEVKMIEHPVKNIMYLYTIEV